MTEVLHVWALAPAAIGTCCLAADRRRARVPELAASVVMLAAMLDLALSRLVPAVLWMAVLLAAAIALAAVRSPRRRRGALGAGERRMTVAMTLGLVVMAALAVAAPHAASAAEPAAHAHGPAADAVALVVVGAAAVYSAWAAALALRMRGRVLDRLQPASMAVSVVAMTLASGMLAG